MLNLADQRAQLEALKTEMINRVNAIKKDISHVDEPLSADWAEQAVERENEEVLNALGNAARDELKQIQAALNRLDNHSYGQCADCGDDIGVKRLQALPFALFCIECADKHT